MVTAHTNGLARVQEVDDNARADKAAATSRRFVGITTGKRRQLLSVAIYSGSWPLPLQADQKWSNSSSETGPLGSHGLLVHSADLFRSALANTHRNKPRRPLGSTSRSDPCNRTLRQRRWSAPSSMEDIQVHSVNATAGAQ
jgi:hypothetical protein